MRSVLARLAFSGAVVIAFAGCGSGSPTSPGSIPNDSGGSTVPVSSQNPPGSLVPGVLIDGGIVATAAYSGLNAVAVDAQSALDAGTDPKTSGSGSPPADPAGSHQITFSGSNSAQIIFTYGGTVPALSYSSTIPGQITPADYGAIVLYAGLVPGATPLNAEPPRVAIELTGGSNFTSYDVRILCGGLAATGATPGAPLERFVCALPAYGASSGTTGTVTLAAATALTPAVTTSYNVDANISNPRTAGATGSFTPGTPKMYVELIYGSPTPSSSTGNALDIDYVYAEAGTK